MQLMKGPFSYQPNPKRAYWCQLKPEKLVRRGPRHYVVVGSKPDGTRVETRLTAGSVHMEGFF